MRSLIHHAVHGDLPLPSALPPNGWINSPGKVPVMIPRAFFELPPPTKYRCAECEAEFDAELPLRNHQLATKHERQKDEDTNQFICAECGKGFGTFEKMRSHKNNAHGVKLDCRINDCEYRGFSVAEMVDHMYQRHNHECPYPACGWHHSPPPHPPHQTTQKTRRHGLTGCFSVAVHWDAHHTDDKHNSPCPYPTCAFVAKDMSELMTHLHRINHYSCSVCGHMEKSVQPRLAEHIDSHHNGLGDIVHTTMPKLTRVFFDERLNE
ncbi:hypothetical protein B0T11DRAFT_342295 [Plectosphaerella cucumerina]|uniref:C2H2-type domain-containing protein n=1 Tax=Plectosphaerella cucumerina TaxID=40658 RepID=A0A8K0TAZ9_9PEZI|nr:hypothetical protein B0T11DRAFT_342295 [Plectosphaerella cucumerina]